MNRSRGAIGTGRDGAVDGWRWANTSVYYSVYLLGPTQFHAFVNIFTNYFSTSVPLRARKKVMKIFDEFHLTPAHHESAGWAGYCKNWSAGTRRTARIP